MMPKLYSTNESVRQGDWSFLAIAETVLATTLSIFLAHQIGSLYFITIGACLAPLLLLRTEESSALAIIVSGDFFLAVSSKMYAFIEWLEKLIRYSIIRVMIVTVCTIVAIVFLMVSFLMIKIGSTVCVLLRNPLGCIRGIPANWARFSFQIDSFRPPEVLPGLEDHIESSGLADHPLKNFKFTDWYRSDIVRSEGEGTLRIIDFFVNYVILGLPLILFGYIPAFIYRWSLKSTTLVYLPLIYAIHSNLGREGVNEDRLGDILDDPLEKLSRIYAWFVVIGLNAVPFGFMVHAFAIRERFAAKFDFLVSSNVSPMLGYRILKIFTWLTPDQIEIGIWHILRLGGAAITIWLFSYAKRAVRKIDKGIWPVVKVEETIRRWMFARALSGLVVTLYSIVILVQSVDWNHVPNILLRFTP